MATLKCRPYSHSSKIFYQVFGQNETEGVNYDKQDFRRDLAKRTDLLSEPVSAAFRNWCEQFPLTCDVPTIQGDKIALVWNRQQIKDPERNSSETILNQLFDICVQLRFTPVLVGSDLPANFKVKFTQIQTRFYRDHDLSPIQQLLYLKRLINERPSISVGLQSGALDGLALFCGQPTFFISTSETANNGMIEMANAIPHLYHFEIDSLEKINGLDPHDLLKLTKFIQAHFVP